MNENFDVLIGVVMILLAFSPILVFNAINNIITNQRGTPVFDRDIFDEEVHIHVRHGDDSFHCPLTVDRDGAIFAKLQHMESITKGTNAHQVWVIKRAEFERKLRWANMMDKFDGHETVPRHY